MERCCIICLKSFPGNFSHHLHNSNQYSHNDTASKAPPGLETNEGILLQRFFKLLERYLSVEEGEEEDILTSDNLKWRKSLLKLLRGGELSSCRDCSAIIQSFSDLFHEMKKIELLLQLRIWKIKSISNAAIKVPERVATVKGVLHLLAAGIENENGEDDNDDSGAKLFSSLIQFKKSIVKKCSRKLLYSFPKLQIPDCVHKEKGPSKAEVANFIFDDNLVIKQEAGEIESFQPILTSSDQEECLSEEEEIASSSENAAATSFEIEKFEKKNDTDQVLEEAFQPIITSVQGGFPQDSDTVPTIKTNEEPFSIKIERQDSDEQSDNCNNVQSQRISIPVASRNLQVTNAEEDTYVSEATVTEVAKFKCPHCSNQFPTNRNLSVRKREQDSANKIKRVNPKIRRYTCQICLKDCVTPQELTNHHDIVHSGNRFKCAFCCSLFKQIEVLNSHMKFKCKASPPSPPKAWKILLLREQQQRERGSPAWSHYIRNHAKKSIRNLLLRQRLQRQYHDQQSSNQAHPPQTPNDHDKSASDFLNETTEEDEPLHEQMNAHENYDVDDHPPQIGHEKERSNSLNDDGFQSSTATVMEHEDAAAATTTANHVNVSRLRNGKDSNSALDVDVGFACQICRKRFRKRKSVANHIDVVHRGLKWKCLHCPRTFGLENSAKTHMEKLHDFRGVPLRVIEDQSTSSSSAKVKETLIPKYVCHLCNEVFNGEHSLALHIFKDHSENPYDSKKKRKRNYEEGECHLCNEVFTGDHSLALHIFKNHSENPYE